MEIQEILDDTKELAKSGDLQELALQQLKLMDENIVVLGRLEKKVRISHGLFMLCLLLITIIYMAHSYFEGLLNWGDTNFYIVVFLSSLQLILRNIALDPVKAIQNSTHKLERLRVEVGALAERKK